MAEIPTLTTRRLLLRPILSDDWTVYEAFIRSERSRHLGGPFDGKTGWGMFCANHAQWDLFGCGALMIEDRQSGDCIGQVGIDAGPLSPEKGLSWFLVPGAEGHGYVSEAVAALRDWARFTFKLRTLVSYIDHDNMRARNLLARLGAEIDEYAPRPDPSILVFRHFCMRQKVVDIPMKAKARGRPRKVTHLVQA